MRRRAHHPAQCTLDAKRRLAVAAASTLALCWSGAAATPSLALEPVTTIDEVGDFETVGTVPQGWVVRAPDPNSVVASGSRAISGQRSMRIQDLSDTYGATATSAKFTVVSGSEYRVQGYAFMTKGMQTLAINFYDASGERIYRTSSSAQPAGGGWSRVSLRALPPEGAATATVQLSSATTGQSEGWWDAISTLRPIMANAGFEEPGTSSDPIPAWRASTSGGATVQASTDYQRTGRRAALMTDGTTSGAAVLRGPLTPVFPGVAADTRFWMRRDSGDFRLAVNWYDKNRRYISQTRFSLSAPAGDWQLMNRIGTAPYNAHFASVELSTTTSGRGTAAFDGFTVAPNTGSLTRPSTVTSMGEPLKGFSNTMFSGMVTVQGRPKMYSIVSGYPAAFGVVDVQTGEVEQHIPFDDANISQSAAMVTGQDGNVYLGTHGGLLWRWTPGTSSLEKLGRVTPSATAVFDLEVGEDGRIWGGTYPDGAVFSYVPGTDTFTNLGTVAEGRQYARSVAVDDRHLYVGVGPANPTVYRLSLSNPQQKSEIAPPVRLSSGHISEMEVYGRFLATNMPSGQTTSGGSYTGQRYLYDIERGTWDVPANMPGQSPVGTDSEGRFFYIASRTLYSVGPTSRQRTALTITDMDAGRNRMIYNGTLDAESGEWLVAHSPSSGMTAINLATYEERSYDFTFNSTSLRMKSLEPGPDGHLYAGGYGGASLAIIDPETGAAEQYPRNRSAQGVIGEVEGMIANGPYQFLGTYTRSKIFRYDTRQEWSDGTNPELIADLTSHDQDRPMAWATAGSRTFFGTVPENGKLGGVLGIIDTPTSGPRILPSPVRDQSIVSLAAHGDVVYGGTSRWGGLGATPTQGSARIFAYDAAQGRLLWSVAPQPGAQSFGAVMVAPNGNLWAAAGPVIYELSRFTGEVMRKVTVNTLPQPNELTYNNVDLAHVDGLIYLAAIDRVFTIDPKTLRVEAPVTSGLTHRRLAEIDGDVYYPSGTELRKISRGATGPSS